jgi:hypothetical protein
MRLTLLIPAFLLLSGLSASTQVSEGLKATGRITGTVLDQRGQPLNHIAVRAVREETGIYMPGAETSSSGWFVIEELEPGAYDIFGESDLGGYPDTALSFYSKAEPTKVFLRAGDTAGIKLILGPPAGIWSGVLIDKATGRLVATPHAPHFVVRKVTDPEEGIEFLGSAKFRWLIPPEVDVTLEVNAEGYRPWSALLPSHFQSGRSTKFRIELEPEPHDILEH